MLGRLTRRMRIQYMSDLHLELPGVTPPVVRPIAPTLVLAGDIGNPMSVAYHEFLADCARRWENVVVVAGNHEFYNKRGAEAWAKGLAVPETVADRVAACRSAAAEAGSNVHFLERGRADIGGIAFLGCTLWSDLTGVESQIEYGMNDCRVICAEGTRVARAEDLKTWHQRDRAWLTAELAACREEGRGAVVVTHHLPTYRLISNRYQGHPLNAGFASALDDMICEPVRAWICGHSHVASVLHAGPDGRVPCVLNPRGYPGESRTGFCAEMFVDVDTGSGPGADERSEALVEAADDLTILSAAIDMDVLRLTERPGESVSAPSPQRPAAQERSSAAAETRSDDDSESDTSPESVVFL